MKVLVIGSGGREHAMVWKLALSPHIKELWAAPGNAGMAEEQLLVGGRCQCVEISSENIEALLQFALEKKIDFTVVGPDNPLALGIVDLFQSKGLRIWGPNKKAAQFESSKAFSQAFMERHGIPTARSATFSNYQEALAYAQTLDGHCAVKADGLALGKGVIITTNMGEATQALEEILNKKSFGEAGSKVVIQEFLEGVEISLHALCDGKTAKIFPTAQDHKRALENDQGLNTGGMGTYSPTPFLTEDELEKTASSILDPWVRGCQAEGISFQGILYPGVMLTKDGPRVLEFNARFGDPETQVYLMRLDNDLLELLDASERGTLEKVRIKWNPHVAVCVVMASGDYPGNYKKGVPITGLENVPDDGNVKVFHAGTKLVQNQVVTNGGRVLGVTALGHDLKEALARAYAAVDKIHFEGAQFRRDIAAKALS